VAPLRIAIAGAGLIGRAHVARITASTECVLAAIADPSDAAAVLAAELKVPHFATLEEMLDTARPDGVILATPNAAHVPNALRAVARGIPALVEKPIADTVEDGEKLVAAAETARVPLLVGHHRRHNPMLAAARAAIAKGELGRIATVTALVQFLKPDPYFDVAWRREAGGGPVLINLIHAIDDLRFLVGEIAALQAFASNALRGFPVEDSAVVNLRFANGALGTITLSDAAAAPWSYELTARENAAYPPSGEDCYFVSGTHGALAIPSLRTWRYAGERSWNAPLAKDTLAVTPADPLMRQLAHFCAVIRGDAEPLVSGRDALRTLAATVGILQAAGNGMTLRLA
jgi:predicted dehydrogenase